MSTAPRQQFQGHDDLLLLTQIAQAPPWRHRGGVMDAWQQIAQTLNGNEACSLSTLTAAATRARFFRMVAQRRARQDKMLRRGVKDEQQYEQKLQLLDTLIARMDAYEEESSLHQLLRGVDEDAGIEASGHALPLPTPIPVHQVPQPMPMPVRQPSTSQWLQTAMPHAMQPPHQAPVPFRPPPSVSTVGIDFSQPRPAQSTFPTNTLPARTTSTPTQQPAVKKPKATQRVPPASVAVIPIDSPDGNRVVVPPQARRPHRLSESPTKKNTTVATSESHGWERIADRALEFMQRKLELDREAAEAERAWRREEARVRQSEITTMREQTDRLIHAVLELAKSKS